MHDVLTLRRSTEALRARDRLFRSAFDHAPIGMALVAPDGHWLCVNDALCRIFGYSREELLGMTFQDLTHPEDLEADLAAVRQLLRGEAETYQTEKRYLHREGHAVWALLSVSLVREPEGHPPFFIAQVQDITEQRLSRAALAEAHAQLRQRNRELEEFTYIASHDLQEPLRKIRAFADLLLGEYRSLLSEEGRYYLQRMQDAAGRMSDLINDLLVYSRISTSTGKRPFRTVDLKQVLSEVLSDLERQIAEAGATLRIGNLPEVEADRAQVYQLFENLLSNALKFRQPGRPLVVDIHADVELGSEPEAPDVCRLTITDNGIGFDEKYLERIFMPFERLHGPGAFAGTGMGLAICRRIVERHRGTITASGGPGQGASFVVCLPTRQTAAGVPA